MASIVVKYVILLVYVVLLIAAGALIAVFGPNECVRRACVRKAKFIQNSMDTSVNPCDDFYGFSCGNFDQIVPYRSKGVASVIDHIELNIDNILYSLTRHPLRVTDDRILKILKKIYQPCIDKKLIDIQGVQPLWDAIYTSGGFPVVEGDDWDEDSFSIGAFEHKSRRSGFSSQRIFQSEIAQDRTGTYSIHIRPPIFKGLPGNEIVTEKYTDLLASDYLSFIVRLTFTLLGKEDYEADEYKETRQQYEKELKDTIAFKIGLGREVAKYSMEQDPVDLYNRMSLEHLNKEFPYIDWKVYFQLMLPPGTKLPKSIVVVGTSYFRGIKKLALETPKRIIGNYLMLENVFEGCLFLPASYFAIYNKFITKINIKNVRRESFCDTFLKDSLKGALSSLFMQYYNFTERSQPILQDIATRMRKKIRLSIESLKWMDDKTKESAILKLKKTKFTLSMSDEDLRQIQDKEARAKYYEDLCLGRKTSQVLLSYFCIVKFHVSKNWQLLTRKATVFDKDTRVFVPEITYLQEQNELLVPYSVLMYPSFDGQWPMYLNYGGIGSLLGVVFTRGYNADGANYNDLGFEAKWWTPTTTSLYAKQSECMEDQFLAYARAEGRSFHNITIKKTRNLPKHLADFEGTNLAYKAYTDYSKSRFLKEQSLPGLGNFTAEQLFFIGFANIECAYYKPKRLKILLQKQTSIPFDYKVKGSLRNLPGFSKAFGCEPGKKMNPNKKCKFLW